MELHQQRKNDAKSGIGPTFLSIKEYETYTATLLIGQAQ